MKIGLTLSPQTRIYGAFYIYALALGAIYPRLGDLQSGLGLSEGQLGLALIGPGAGTLIALTFGGRVIELVGAKRLLVGGVIGLALAMAMATISASALALFGTLFLAGLLIGAIEIVVNLEADRVEHQVGRRIMSRCHAFWSLGFFSAGVTGAIAKQLSITPQLQLFGMVPIVAVGTLLLVGQLAPAAARATEASAQSRPVFAAPSMGILVLVALTLSATFLEGAATDWSVIYMRDIFTEPPFINGMAFTIGALAMTICRYFADGFVERFGAVTVARVLVTTLGAGATMVALAPNAGLALVGFGLIGIGASALFPLAMSAAAQRTDRPAALNVAALAQIAFMAFLVGPPVLGLVAEHFGLRISFAVCLPLVVISWFAIPALAAGRAGKKAMGHG